MLSIRNGFQNVASLILLILLVSWDKIEEPKISSKTAKKEKICKFYYCLTPYTFYTTFKRSKSLFKGSDLLCKVVELRTQCCGKLL